MEVIDDKISGYVIQGRGQWPFLPQAGLKGRLCSVKERHYSRRELNKEFVNTGGK